MPRSTIVNVSVVLGYIFDRIFTLTGKIFARSCRLVLHFLHAKNPFPAVKRKTRASYRNSKRSVNKTLKNDSDERRAAILFRKH